MTPEGQVLYESRLDEAAVDALSSAGFGVDQALHPYAFKMGGLNLVWRDGDQWVGVGEPRRDGLGAGTPRTPLA